MWAVAKGKRKSAEELSPAIVERIRDSIGIWYAGRWAEEVCPGPACVCGLPRQVFCGRHPEGRQP